MSPTLPLFDDRKLLYWRCDVYRADDVVPITQMGGLMTFRAKAVAGMTFDASAKKLRVRDDDRDFCFAVARRVGRGPRVFGMVGARLTHNPSPVGRFRGRPGKLKVASQHYFHSRHLRGSALTRRFSVLTHFDAGRSTIAALHPHMCAPITIDRDAYLGAGAPILAGVTVGSRAVVAAGGVVTTDVQPDDVVGGVPARRLSGRRTAQVDRGAGAAIVP